LYLLSVTVVGATVVGATVAGATVVGATFSVTSDKKNCSLTIPLSLYLTRIKYNHSINLKTLTILSLFVFHDIVLTFSQKHRGA
jgi:hypothetical protein